MIYAGREYSWYNQYNINTCYDVLLWMQVIGNKHVFQIEMKYGIMTQIWIIICPRSVLLLIFAEIYNDLAR